MLSELEGAIMLEVHMRNRSTAFRVRSAFLNSPTSDWSGSAGAVYPAIKRLETKGYIVRLPKTDGRGTHTLSATEDGITALHTWATDPELAARISADPFRTRSDYLKALPPRQRDTALKSIKAELTEALARIDELIVQDDPYKEAANALAAKLLKARMDWIEQPQSED